MLAWLWLGWLVLLVFVIGSAVGSFLNVCIARLPLGQSLIFPGSRCGSCRTPIPFRDNIPLLSYWLLAGRCRVCGASFSMRYFWVELATGLGFVAVFILEVGLNTHQVNGFGFWYLEAGYWPPHAVPFLAARLVMLGVLVVAFCCALERQRVPWAVLKTGLFLAAAEAALCPWPWPHAVPAVVATDNSTQRGAKVEDHGSRTAMPIQSSILDPRSSIFDPRSGLQAWPVWAPLPSWLPAGSTQLGLAILLGGVLVGGVLTTLVHMCLGGVAGNRGDAVFLLLCGAFLGWQPALVAVVAGTCLAAVLALPLRLMQGSVRAGLTCGLGIGVVGAWVGWPWLGPLLDPILFDARQLPWLLGAPVLLVILGFWLRWLR